MNSYVISFDVLFVVLLTRLLRDLWTFDNTINQSIELERVDIAKRSAISTVWLVSSLQLFVCEW